MQELQQSLLQFLENVFYIVNTGASRDKDTTEKLVIKSSLKPREHQPHSIQGHS